MEREADSFKGAIENFEKEKWEESHKRRVWPLNIVRHPTATGAHITGIWPWPIEDELLHSYLSKVFTHVIKPGNEKEVHWKMV